MDYKVSIFWVCFFFCLSFSWSVMKRITSLWEGKEAGAYWFLFLSASAADFGCQAMRDGEMGTAGPLVLLLFLSSMEVSLSQRTKATSLGDGGCQRAWLFFFFEVSSLRSASAPRVWNGCLSFKGRASCQCPGHVAMDAVQLWLQALGLSVFH